MDLRPHPLMLSLLSESHIPPNSEDKVVGSIHIFNILGSVKMKAETHEF